MDCPPVTRQIQGQGSYGGTSIPLANTLSDCLRVSNFTNILWFIPINLKNWNRLASEWFPISSRLVNTLRLLGYSMVPLYQVLESMPVRRQSATVQIGVNEPPHKLPFTSFKWKHEIFHVQKPFQECTRNPSCAGMDFGENNSLNQRCYTHTQLTIGRT